MNEILLKKKLSTKTYHKTGLFMVIALLGINYLLYAFFDIETLKTPIRLFAMLVLLVIYFYKEKVAFHHIVILGTAAYLILIQGELSINIAFLLIAGMCLSHIEDEIIYKYMNIINLATLVIVVFSLITGLDVSTLSEISGRSREDLGFNNINSAGLVAYSIVCVFLLSCKKVKITHIALGIAISIFVFVKTDSRTGFYGSVAFFVLWPLLTVIPSYIKRVVLPVACSLMFVSPFLWLLPGMQTHESNLEFSFRPWLFKQYVESISRRIFMFGGNKHEGVDNFYLVFLGNAGIIIYLGLLLMLIMSILKLAKNNENKKIAFIFSALTISMTETSLIRPEIMSMLAFWVMLFKCFQDIKTDRKVEVKRCKYVKYKT